MTNIDQRRVVAVSTFAALAFGAIAGATAVAQTPSWWTDPAGIWSLDLGSAGWGSGAGLPANNPTVLLAVPMAEPAENEVRVCLAEQLVDPGSAADAKTRAAQLKMADVEALLARMNVKGGAISHIEVGGVSVASFDGTSGKNRLRARIFFTAAGQQTVLTKIMCISDPKLRDDLAGEIETILGSLKFAPVDSRS